MKIYINKHDKDKNVIGRKEVDVVILKETNSKFLVQLPNGNIITRKKSRDIVK